MSISISTEHGEWTKARDNGKEALGGIGKVAILKIPHDASALEMVFRFRRAKPPAVLDLRYIPTSNQRLASALQNLTLSTHTS